MFDFDKSTGEIFLYDDIGPAWLGMIDASTVRSAVKEYDEDARLQVRINSPGGSVDDGIAIYNMLKRHPGGVDVHVDSLAASIASYIALAGETVAVARNGMFMVHSPWTIAMGNAEDFRDAAAMLDKYQERIEDAYKEKMGVGDDEIKAIMAAETWYTASEAVDAGLADKTDAPTDEVVAVAAGRFKHTPDALLRPAKAGSRTTWNHDAKRYEYQRRRFARRK